MLARFTATLVTAALAFLFGIAVHAQTRPSADAPRCPRHRVHNGDACSVDHQRCHFACGHEGARGLTCTCHGGTSKRWVCVEGPVCAM